VSEEGGQFYLFPADGGPPRPVLSYVPRTINLAAFTWLDDNRHVVMALSDSRLRSRHLWVVDTQSEAMRQVTVTHTNETEPAFAPASRQLAYVTEDVDFDLIQLSEDGRSRTTILSTARNEFDPAWSPSGDRFAFVTDRTGGLEIWGRSRDGQWERPIVRASDFNSVTESIGALAYSSDGNTLAFQRSGGGVFEIWTAPATGGAPVRLIESPAAGHPYQNAPSWSPDNTWIAFAETPGDQIGQQLKKVRVGTRQIETLGEGVASFSPVRWSPDGNWILVQTLEGLARVPANGGQAQMLSTEGFMDFVWAPDSRRVFAMGDSETIGHFALVEIDSLNGAMKMLNADLGPVPVANQPIRGFAYLPGQGFLTSMASARSDIWLIDGVQPLRRGLLDWFRR
jgi:TolB protein